MLRTMLAPPYSLLVAFCLPIEFDPPKPEIVHACFSPMEIPSFPIRSHSTNFAPSCCARRLVKLAILWLFFSSSPSRFCIERFVVGHVSVVDFGRHLAKHGRRSYSFLFRTLLDASFPMGDPSSFRSRRRMICRVSLFRGRPL